MYKSLSNQYNTDMSFLDQFQTFLQALEFEFSLLSIVDILIVAFIFYWIIAGLRGTRGIRILWGGAVLGLIFFFAQIFNLIALQWLLAASFAVLIVAIPVVFQPELRKLLERAGKNRFLKSLQTKTDGLLTEKEVQQITAAVKTLSANKTGALIVVTREDTLRDITETGIAINADISKELLLNIFFPKSPLHDGAVVIQDGIVRSASSLLPLSEKEKAYHLGTRHRAAIGLTEESDALVIVVSEERGSIALASNEELIEDISPKDLAEELEERL